MLNKKLQADYWNEMCYQLLKLMIQKMNIKFRGGLLGLKDFKMILRVTTAQLVLLVVNTAGTKVNAAGLQLLEELLLKYRAIVLEQFLWSKILFHPYALKGSSPDIVYFRKRSRSDKVLLIQNFSTSFGFSTCERVTIDLEAFSDSDYAGASLDRKSTTGAEYVAAANCCGLVWNTATSKTVNSVKQIHAIVDGKAVVISESSVRCDLLFNDEDGGGDNVERAITTDASLVAAQDSDNILKTQTTTMPNVDIPQGMDTGGSPRRQETIEGALAQTRSERVLEKPNEPPLSEGHTSGSGEGSMKHTFELMDTVPPTPHDSPLTGGYTPGSDEEGCTSCGDPQTKAKSQEIRKKEEVKHLTPKNEDDDDLDEEDASKQGRESDKTKSMFQDSDFDVLDDDMEDVEGETVHTATTRVSAVSAPVTTAGVAISTVEPRTPPTTATTAFIDEDLTIAHDFGLKMKEEKLKEKGVAN
ncbi:hypothetical protein Tco_0991832 [Tanacetum coccineum]|uniref:Uncharacterized protein n=1 Tax=Tanacetum coccineum TaxID=301880 RepID=A0ABQ5F147_9ASTR